MRHLKHVEAAIDRLGYVKPTYAHEIASLMQEHEGEHPHKIARSFRQRGTPLTADEKRAMGMRANAGMTNEAREALSDKGLENPIKGLDATVLHANFEYFRHRSVENARKNGYDTFQISGTFDDCRGCARLNDEKVTGDFLSEIPPADCDREACALGVNMKVDFIGELVEQEAERKRGRSWISRLFGRK